MENKRILNRIVFINIANTDYSNVEIAGNTCFVGTNNMGKTTLQRAILFFYSANTRQLGISTSQKTFEDYYFQYPNSYIIYELATEEGFFHVMVYRNSKLFYRFVNGAFDPEFYINDKEALQPKAVLAKLNEHKIDYSDQIETFERYRNIIYGADPDKRYKKYALMKGNANYHNIPLAITSIFLSSESVIRAEFVKECIANAIGSRHTTIELKTIERQLRQFSETYQDIETFFRKDSGQRSDLIRDNFSTIRRLKVQQRELAASLGGALKYAEIQKEEITTKADAKRLDLDMLEKEFKEKEEAHRERHKETHQEIGALKSKLKEADRRQQEYEDKGMVDILREAEDKPRLQLDVAARESEYATLTAGFTDIEQQFKTLFDALENERREFEYVLQSQGLQIDKNHQQEKNQLRDQFLKDREKLQQDHTQSGEQYRERKLTLELGLKDAQHKEQQLRQQVYFATDVKVLKENLAEIGRRKPEMMSALKIRNNNIESLKKESSHISERNKIELDQVAKKNQVEIAECEEKIKTIDAKLSVYQDALFGYLQEHYPEWYETIGKVCHEDLLFSKELNPQLIKKSVDTLYGMKLDLSAVPVHSKSLEQYEQERSQLREKISLLHKEFLEFREQHVREENQKLAALSKKIAQLKNEVAQTQYELDQDEQKSRQFELDLHDLKRKGEELREKELVEVYGLQDSLRKEMETLTGKLKQLEEVLAKNRQELEQTYQEKLVKLNKSVEKEVAKITSQKEDKLEELEQRKTKLQKEKTAVLKNKGIDDSRLKKLKKEIDSLKAALTAIEANAPLINDYLKDKRELFDCVNDFLLQKQKLEESIRQSDVDFQKEKEQHGKKRKHLEEEVKQLSQELKEYTDGLAHFENHFRDKILYDRLRHLIDPSPATRTELGIVALCSQLQANDNEYHNQFGKFRDNVSEFAGRFRTDNHFGFRVNATSGEAEYERFASYLEEFYNENKIQVSIAEVAKSHGMLIDAIASKMRALTEYRGRISKMISKMEADFSKASFEGSRLIEYIKLKSEDSENKVLRKLQRIADFREQNPFLYGEENLFNTGLKGKGEIDKRSVELLNDLQRTISEENYEVINVQDLFELRFRIKEGKNDTGWIEKIDKVGSTGTDMLVKAVIYITLLNVFIKESTEKTSRNFKVHCIIDEVGQISAPYLKELIAFADERNICLINGLPNESKLETHYNYTYKFRKDSNGFVKVIPLLTMSVEP
jgi:DNA repair exonuclease SbcCD ATPase subunit